MGLQIIRYFVLFTITITSFYSCRNIHHNQISIENFNLVNTESATIIDVRTKKEFIAGHIKNAKNINWYDDAFISHMKNYDQSSTIYIYCQTGVRSNEAAVALSKIGYTNVINISGGYEAYIRSQKLKH